jgi:membrane protein
MFAEAWTIARKGVVAFIDDNALSRGAAIAFYAVTGFVPALIVAVALLSAVFGAPLIGHVVARALAILMGHEGRVVALLAAKYASGSGNGRGAELIGLAILVVTASGAFSEIQSALNGIWRVGARGLSLVSWLRARLISLLLLTSLGLLLLASIVVTAAIAVWVPHLHFESVFSGTTLIVVNFLLSFALASLLFAAIYKVLPDIDLKWSDVVVGALVTALLYEIGQVFIGAYLESRTTLSGYGATGAMIVLLLWIYYSAQVFLLGAELTKAYATHHRAAVSNRELQLAE